MVVIPGEKSPAASPYPYSDGDCIFSLATVSLYQCALLRVYQLKLPLLVVVAQPPLAYIEKSTTLTHFW